MKLVSLKTGSFENAFEFGKCVRVAGKGDDGEFDATGPWNENIEVVEAPALQGFQVTKATPKVGHTTLNSNGSTKLNGEAKRPAKKRVAT